MTTNTRNTRNGTSARAHALATAPAPDISPELLSRLAPALAAMLAALGTGTDGATAGTGNGTGNGTGTRSGDKAGNKATRPVRRARAPITLNGHDDSVTVARESFGGKVTRFVNVPHGDLPDLIRRLSAYARTHGIKV